jgi:GR25 family glycosyltransferase involved in LPS biosynthesis
MKSCVIVMNGNEVSEFGFEKLNKSSLRVNNDFKLERFLATTPKTVDKEITQLGIEWNYPWSGSITDFGSGLKKSAYATANPKSRISAAVSHYKLWLKCLELNEPILVLEHDSIFKQKIDFDPNDVKFNIFSLNNPLGCTRKASIVYNKIISAQNAFQPVPTIDDETIPQGLPGNSAYIIKPNGADQLVKAVKQFGLWPNDAIMCKQLIKGLGVSRKFYTHIQNLKSTTTL